MNRTDALYQSFLDILREELVPAMGCTEPIAIAYAAAQARAVLGKRPERVRIEVSGNIIKNVKSVIVPHTGSMHGIAAAAAALREQNPDLSLKELAGLVRPPLSKSGLSHRMKKLEQTAESLKERTRNG